MAQIELAAYIFRGKNNTTFNVHYISSYMILAETVVFGKYPQINRWKQTYKNIKWACLSS